MKRVLFISLAAAAAMSVSCQKEEMTSDEQSNQVEISINGAVESNDTKVTYTKEASSYKFAWEADDAFSLIVSDGTNTNVKFTNKNAEAGNNKEFTGTVTSWEGQKNVYAVYPYMQYVTSGGVTKAVSYKVLNPGTNTASIRVFRSYQSISAVENKAETSLLIASAENLTVNDLSTTGLSFKQIMSMLRINVMNVPAEYMVTSVSLSSSESVFPTVADIDVKTLAVTPVSTVKEISSIVTGAEDGAATTLNFSFVPFTTTSDIYVQVILKGASDSKAVLAVKSAKTFAANTIYSLNLDASSSETLPVTDRTIEYAGVTYKTVIAQDGNEWFAENLRYIPSGKTPSTDLKAIDNGLWYPVDMANKKLTDDAETVTSQGYLYNAETAFGLAPGTITADNYDTFEGIQGICPDGWHIPTIGDLLGLAGKCTNYGDTANAPYYTGDNSSRSLANDDGLNMNIFGYVNVANTSTSTGSVQNVMSYILGSSAYTPERGNTQLYNTNGTLKNVVYFSFMPSKQGYFNGGNNSYRSGVSVRCVRRATADDFE